MIDKLRQNLYKAGILGFRAANELNQKPVRHPASGLF